MTQIVVGVDGSEPAQHALRWAAAEATLRDQPLVAVLAWDLLDQHHAVADSGFEPDYDEDHARQALAAYVETVLGPSDAERVELRTVCDLPARALVTAAQDASLLVVAARGHGGFKGLLLGSVSQKVLHDAPCPVAVIRTVPEPDPDGGPPRIVVGVDGSPAADAALRWALEEARHRQAQVDAVMAWRLPVVTPHPYAAIDVDTSALEESAKQVLDDTIRRVGGEGESVNRIASLSGPTSLLLDVATGADLLVVGTRGLHGFQRFLMGSTSHQVTLHATCPVVVVPDAETS